MSDTPRPVEPESSATVDEPPKPVTATVSPSVSWESVNANTMQAIVTGVSSLIQGILSYVLVRSQFCPNCSRGHCVSCHGDLPFKGKKA
jgi:hypothetical protein